ARYRRYRGGPSSRETAGHVETGKRHWSSRRPAPRRPGNAFGTAEARARIAPARSRFRAWPATDSIQLQFGRSTRQTRIPRARGWRKSSRNYGNGLGAARPSGGARRTRYGRKPGSAETNSFVLPTAEL